MFRVSFSVPLFVMVMCNVYSYAFKIFICRFPQNFFYNNCSLFGMGLHLLIFFGSKLTRLSQNRIINRNFSKVMHRCSFYKQFAEFFRNFRKRILVFKQLPCKNPYAVTCARNMAACRVVATFNHNSHTADNRFLHARNLSCFFTNHPRKLFVKIAYRFYVVLLLGIITKLKQITCLLHSCSHQMNCTNNSFVIIKDFKILVTVFVPVPVFVVVMKLSCNVCKTVRNHRIKTQFL